MKSCKNCLYGEDFRRDGFSYCVIRDTTIDHQDEEEVAEKCDSYNHHKWWKEDEGEQQ